MDVAAVRTCIESTLDANADTRRQAELNLKAVRCGVLNLAGGTISDI